MTKREIAHYLVESLVDAACQDTEEKTRTILKTQTDEQIIKEMFTCDCCGEVALTQEEIDDAIDASDTIQEFKDICTGMIEEKYKRMEESSDRCDCDQGSAEEECECANCEYEDECPQNDDMDQMYFPGLENDR